MVFRSGPVAPGVAFVTGGARGLGNAIGVSFAKEGARGVCLVDIQDEATFEEGKKNVEKYGTRVLCIRADVTKEADVERAVDEAVKEFGRIDYAANFAGIIGPLDVTWETDTDKWRRVIEVNTVGVWLCNKYQLRQMMKQESIEVEEGRPPQRGSIVNCASVNSIQAGAGTTGYSASKHAVMGLTKAASLEARSHNIRINAVSPGFLLTRLLDPLIAQGDSGMATWAEYEARQGRKATFDEVGDVVVLLSTPRMSLVVGHNLVIDGGFTINENTY
ncbi:hypothetical protein LTR10_021563 [Elasticomyces elasticus]|uniref:NAD(P)-binding protein n=1 Tax=Exophiala sideris TaxID=1016849 RepID=A0ABR0JKU8_9EURO|nr:hypothetical protein LTR10_021563 [Elasticomyces elasticus]KAK5035150.1 hypothetical protein LTS07_002586 [Exophiala sideris]KAK5039498.1 hypothetical protein LTR13_003755 [Exophiala sideris]KAK5066074.1 hypothetical protein LTR69_002592 [Exophiala sideris]KAK5186751.1 hypothetical protein LTR44_000757 [Eurotiomycetes sp. CCFEE 6388]